MNSVVVNISGTSLSALASDPDVAYIAPDRPLHPTLDYTASAVNASIAFDSGYTGSGIGIAVIDSGITPHADLSHVVYSESFVPGDSSVLDGFGHGTHVAGILGGSGAMSSGPTVLHTFRGMAPDAQLINLRVFGSNGIGRDSAVIGAIDRAIQLKALYNIGVINLSLGRAVYESYTVDPLCQAVEQAWKAGMVVVVAAGNDGRNNSFGNSGYGTINSPGNDPYVITVGAMKTQRTYASGDDLIASYSSKGPTLFDHVVKPDLVAPGNRVISDASGGSTLSESFPSNLVTLSYYQPNETKVMSKRIAAPAYFTMSGTSMATPVVSGAAALLLQQNSAQTPALTPDQIKARLMKNANKNFPVSSVAFDPTTQISYLSQYDMFTIGAGYLDVWAALGNSDLLSGTALSPSVSYNSANQVATLVTRPSGMWEVSTDWSNQAIWGSNVFMDSNLAIWGTVAIWGTDTNSQAYLAIWGTMAIWGTGTGMTNPETILIKGEN